MSPPFTYCRLYSDVDPSASDTPTSRSYALFLRVGTTVYLKGQLRLRVLIGGRVHTLGWDATPTSGWAELFSPRGSSILGITAAADEAEDGSNSSSNSSLDASLLESFGLESFDVDAICKHWAENKLSRGRVVVVQVSRPEAEYLKHFKKIQGLSDKLFGSEARQSSSLEKELDVSLFLSKEAALKAGLRCVAYHDKWQSVVDNVIAAKSKEDGGARVMVCGGKGVGKSTFLRYLTNKLLKAVGPVLYVDFDPGQAELTIPGCVSASLVTSPLLGPNFCHVHRPNLHVMFLGGVSVSDHKQRFQTCIKRLVRILEERENLSDLPWVVNTMGFNSGLGAHLMEQTIDTVKPSVIVSIRSAHKDKNYQINLKSLGHAAVRKGTGFSFMEMSAVPESSNRAMGTSDTWGIPEAWKLRDLVLTSYLAELVLLKAKDEESVSAVEAAATYYLPFKDVSFQILTGANGMSRASVPSLFNGTVVALGMIDGLVNKDDESKEDIRLVDAAIVADTVAIAVVRCVQVPSRRLVVTVSKQTSPAALTKVNCVTLGGIRMPDNLVLDSAARAKAKQAPYVARTEAEDDEAANPLSQPWRKNNKPRTHMFNSQ